MTTEKLFVEFCEGEKQARMEKIIEELAQIERWEDAKSGATKHYNEMIKEADARIKGWRAELDAGGTEEDVDVEWKMDDPEKGQKTLYRLDTMEPIRMEEMGLFDSRKSDAESDSDGSDDSDESDDELEDGEPVKLKPAKTIICDSCNRCDGTGHICARCGKPAEYYMQFPGEGCVCDDCQYEAAENADPKDVCYKCGNMVEKVYHIAAGKICDKCIARQNHKKYVELNERIVKCREAGKQLLFRADFGFGVVPEKADLTCFRFLDHEHGWGLNIYEPGQVNDGFSAAWRMYEWLIRNDVKRDC